MNGRCGTCMHWRQKELVLLEGRPHAPCHGGPPTAGQRRIGLWPLTEEHEACGSYEIEVPPPSDPAPQEPCD